MREIYGRSSPSAITLIGTDNNLVAAAGHGQQSLYQDKKLSARGVDSLNSRLKSLHAIPELETVSETRDSLRASQAVVLESLSAGDEILDQHASTPF